MTPTYFEQGAQWHDWLNRAQAGLALGLKQSQFVAQAGKSEKNIARRAYKSAVASKRLTGAMDKSDGLGKRFGCEELAIKDAESAGWQMNSYSGSHGITFRHHGKPGKVLMVFRDGDGRWWSQVRKDGAL